MSTEQPTSWTTYAIAAALSALIGFGAIYVMLGGGGNGSGEIVSKADRQGTATTGDAGASQAGGQLNVGKMTTFVFKHTPAPLPEAKFNNSEGKPISLKDFAGKVVLLNLWATWCAPCRKEMPDLDALQAELGGDKFEVVAVSVDRGSAAKSRKFLDDIKVKSLKLYHVPSTQLGFTLKTIGMPSTLLIDAKGREVGRLVGPAEWSSADAKRLIRAYLPKTGS